MDDTVVTDSHRRRNNVGAGERRRLPGGGGIYGVTHGHNSAINFDVLSSHLDSIREWVALLSYLLLPFLVILFYSGTSEFPSFGQVAEFSEESLCLLVILLMGRRVLGGGGQPERGEAMANNWVPSIRVGIFFAAIVAIAFVYLYMMRVGDAESESVPDPG
jgi:hypothetical protein